MRRRKPPRNVRGPRPGRRKRERDPLTRRAESQDLERVARPASNGPRRWRAQDTRKLSRVVHKLSDERLAEKHARVRAGGSPSRPHVGQALEMLWGAASWEVRRAMLVDLGGLDDAPLLPGLARLVSGRDAMTSVVVAEACVRIGSSAATPLLSSMLDDSVVGVRVAAVRALGALGTRRDMFRLSEVLDGAPRRLAALTREALDAIDARHPADGLAEAGSLSISELGVEAGALTEALGEDGALDLYEGVAREVERVTRMEIVEVERAEMTRQGAWHALGPAPRMQPVAAAREMMTWGANGLSALGWLCVGVGALSGPIGPTVAACVMVGAAFVFMGAWRMRHRWSMLRHGQPGFARPVGHQLPDVEATPPRPNHVYTFKYVTLSGESRTFERDVPVRREAWGSEPVEVMYLPGPGVDLPEGAQLEILGQELLSTAQVDASGRWMSDPQQMALTAAPAAMAIGAWVVRLVL